MSAVPKASFVYYPGGFATGWTFHGLKLTDGRSMEINPARLTERRLDALERSLGRDARQFVELLLKLPSLAGTIRLSENGFRVAINNKHLWPDALTRIRKALLEVYGIEQLSYG
ncbi:MAG TPA: hypothetical protein VNU47_00280 [Candidatus Paceibacterota bacterium]|nr:hypothetical protein [Candidatus Paceibacterota bacterium]